MAAAAVIVGEHDNPVNVHIQNFIGSIPIFDPSQISLSGWFELFDEFCIANGIPDEPPAVDNVVPHNQKRALFLSHIGSRAYEHLRKWCLPNRPNRHTIPVLMDNLRSHFEPRGLVATHQYTFDKRVQRDNETVAQYLGALHQLAAACDFGVSSLGPAPSLDRGDQA